MSQGSTMGNSTADLSLSVCHHRSLTASQMHPSYLLSARMMLYTGM